MRRNGETGTLPLGKDSGSAHAVRDVSSVWHTRAVLRLLFGPAEERTFAVRLWDGTTETPRAAPEFTFELRHPGVLRQVLLPPSELKLAHAFVRNDIDIQGDLEAAVGLGDLFAQRIFAGTTFLKVIPHLLMLPGATPHGRDDVRTARGLTAAGRPHDEARDEAAIRFHYDIGNEFYALWLDDRMVYSCAYFPTGTESLGEAQEAKLDLVCRKLGLRPGERLLDIGAGWGALVRRAAERYGADATGITVSENQARFAQSAIAKEGLTGRARVELRDYRKLEDSQAFDRIASVGMVEHVGRARLDQYFAAVFRLLRPGGLFLNHGIVALDDARPRPLAGRIMDRLWKRASFIYQSVFPDGEILQLAEMVRSAEAACFETRHVETLREHYMITLRHWRGRLESAHTEAAALVGEGTYRLWRLYLAASARGFASGRLGVVQMLLAKPLLDGGAAPCEAAQ
jgi:cyclopropane-fatty-acyl-phospholipid synthase